MPGPKKLLVADDSLTIQKVIRLALSNEGYEIQAVSDGNDAHQQISLFRPDVVLIDVSLPSKSAFEVKDVVNGHDDLAGVKFVLMSSAFEQVDEQKVKETGFDGRLIKPFDPAHLRKVLGQVLSEPSRAASPEASAGMLAPPDLSGPAPMSETIAPEGDDADSELQTLTDTTLSMTGMDEGGWTVHDEPRKTDSARPTLMGETTLTNLRFKEPTLRPPPGLLDSGDPLFSGDADAYVSQVPAADAPPPPSAHESVRENEFEPIRPDPPESTMSFEAPDTFEAPPESPAPQEKIEEPSGAYTGIAGLGEPRPDVVAISSSQVEAMVGEQVRKSVEDVLRKLLPDIAERVIKDEIHRLLSNPPGTR